MRCRRPKTIMRAKVTSARPITARAIVTFWFQQLILACSFPPLVTFSPQLDFPSFVARVALVHPARRITFKRCAAADLTVWIVVHCRCTFNHHVVHESALCTMAPRKQQISSVDLLAEVLKRKSQDPRFRAHATQGKPCALKSCGI